MNTEVTPENGKSELFADGIEMMPIIELIEETAHTTTRQCQRNIFTSSKPLKRVPNIKTKKLHNLAFCQNITEVSLITKHHLADLIFL